MDTPQRPSDTTYGSASSTRASTTSCGGSTSSWIAFLWVDTCFNAALDSLDLNLEEIVVNLFYLNARQANVYEAKEPHLFGEKEVSLLLLLVLRVFLPKRGSLPAVLPVIFARVLEEST